MKISKVHVGILLDNQQVCLRYIFSREDLSDYLNETQIRRIANEIPFNRSFGNVIGILSDEHVNMLVNRPHLRTALILYIKNQPGGVSDEVIDLLFSRPVVFLMSN